MLLLPGELRCLLGELSPPNSSGLKCVGEIKKIHFASLLLEHLVGWYNRDSTLILINNKNTWWHTIQSNSPVWGDCVREVVIQLVIFEPVVCGIVVLWCIKWLLRFSCCFVNLLLLHNIFTFWLAVVRSLAALHLHNSSAWAVLCGCTCSCFLGSPFVFSLIFCFPELSTDILSAFP